jgi:LPS export ABC transporter protein LptC
MTRACALLGVLVAALAAAACGGEEMRPTSVTAEADSADQVLVGFSYNVLRNGIRRSLLEADTAFYYDTRQVSVLKRVRATFYDDAGSPSTTLTADRMEYDLQDGSMKSEGSVSLVGPEGQRLTSQSLVYDVDQNTLSSDQPFVLLRGADRLEGDGFEADADFSRFQARRMRGTTAQESGT